jgi:small multidrug resistance pump
LYEALRRLHQDASIGFAICVLHLELRNASLALKKIDVSVAYAVWSGVGTALIATIGVLWFKEPATALKLISLGLTIIGVVGLNLSGGGHEISQTK